MYKLRPYQQQAVDNTINFFKKSKDPCVIVLPTGAGKSLVIAELARLARGRVLVLTHVKELVEQNHSKYESYELKAGIYSAGLGKKQVDQKVIFGSIQSVARAKEEFFNDFTLLIVDECHRINTKEDTQYSVVIEKLRTQNPKLCVLGLTATPYRLGLGWIYEYNVDGELKTNETRFFKRCIYELSLNYMIKNKYLTRPVKVDIPVTCYDFSELTEMGRMYTTQEVEDILTKQKKLTPLIIKNIIDIAESYDRKGVMLFSSSVKHAKEILSYLPDSQSKAVFGDTSEVERAQIIESFKKREFKYLVNVSVLTTGFDAPHVDVIAILRPTESVSLYQQIIGRGLRLSDEKEDCFVLDYTGMGHDIYSPEISDKKPTTESEIVNVQCPDCGFDNNFWGQSDDEGNVIQHYGRRCKGAEQDSDSLKIIPCGYLFRFKLCPKCSQANDISAASCSHCHEALTDAESKLKQARLSKNAHVLQPDTIEYLKAQDKNGNPYLQVRYYDYDAEYLSEIFYLNNSTGVKKFQINFLRAHQKRPELNFNFTSPDLVIKFKHLLRSPSFIIARKQDKFWRITEKIFIEELR